MKLELQMLFIKEETENTQDRLLGLENQYPYLPEDKNEFLKDIEEKASLIWEETYHGSWDGLGW